VARILLVAGTRPEAIKLAPVVLELRARESEFETVFCSTGQHREMLDQVLSVFGLGPDLDLGVMRPRQTLTDLTTSALSALDKAMTSVRPDLVIVQGDTTSAMAGALAAYYHRVPVAHVEAGLRTDDIYQPFPEEGNRRFIGTLAAMHFAPTPYAAHRLQQESVPERKILVTGNTVIDALLSVRNNGRHGAAQKPSGGRRRLLLTMHRRENHGAPLRNVCLVVLELVKHDPDVEVVFPVHPSPLVRETVGRLLGDEPQIRLIEPLGYQEFIRLLDTCYLVLSDSGGIQEEAPALGKPVLVLRDKTERPESISAGTSQLVGTNPMRVLQATERLLYDEVAYRAMAHAENPYGDGRAAERVAAALRLHFGLAAERPAPFAPRLPERERLDS
jgi:UDP-N-acetylglucosamine 2-epimerase (non-hydrolysing)